MESENIRQNIFGCVCCVGAKLELFFLLLRATANNERRKTNENSICWRTILKPYFPFVVVFYLSSLSISLFFVCNNCSTTFLCLSRTLTSLYTTQWSETCHPHRNSISYAHSLAGCVCVTVFSLFLHIYEYDAHHGLRYVLQKKSW